MNKHARIRSILAALLLLAAPLFAQEREVFAPFVSRLKAAVKDFQVKLSWSDSPDLVGEYLVYRNRSEIETANLPEATLVGQVERGVESFIDTPPEKGEYFYAVLARSNDGKLYDILIPFRNKLMKAIAVEAAPGQKELAATVTGLKAEGRENRIVLNFRASRADRSLTVLRSGSPFADSSGLARAPFSKNLPSSESSFTDYPVPGVPYYYAVVDSALLATGEALLVPGENMTTSFAEIPLGTRFVGLPKRETAPSRALPLPYYRLSSELDSGAALAAGAPAGLPARRPLSPDTRKAVDRLIKNAPAPAEAAMQPQLLPADTIPPASLEEQLLASILSGSFTLRDWKTAAQLLRNFLSVPRSDAVKFRAYYYLGQALYFSNRFEASFASFQSAELRLAQDCRAWMDAILVKLINYSSAEGL